MGNYNKVGKPWTLMPGPKLPEVIKEESQIPHDILVELAMIKAKSSYKQNLIPGPILRADSTWIDLFGATDVMTMWGFKEGKPFSQSPQHVRSIPPAQCVFTIVDIDTDPGVLLIRRTRDLAINIDYILPFWLRGLTPAPMAVSEYLGIETLEFPRGVLADGKGFKVPKEAEEELGLKVRYFFDCGALNPDPGQMMSPLPHKLAIMTQEKAPLDTEGELLTFRAYEKIKPEELLLKLATDDGISKSQVITAIQEVAFGLNDKSVVYDGAGNQTSMSSEDLNKLRAVFIRILQGPLDSLKAACQ